MAAGDTIFALSSGAGRAGVAVVRVSGPAAAEAIHALTGPRVLVPRQAQFLALQDSAGEPIDRGLVLWFAAPGSFTGEDIAEFQVHGGRAVVDAVLGALGALPGLRLAEPGEFTRRAVENGKLDLTQAEAIADLVNAETGAQRRQALRQYDGALAELYEDWRTRLIQASAWAEAAIDFPDEEIPEGLSTQSRAAIGDILQDIQRHMDDGGRGEILRDGLYLTLIGLPNTGKSSLFNALAKREAAIVAATPGTTRDIVEVRLDLGGYPVILADTAGMRESGEAVEAEGVRRAHARARESDLILLLLDGTAVEPFKGLAPEMLARADLTVWNKADLPWPRAREGLAISTKTGEGIQELIADLTKEIAQKLEAKTDSPPLTRVRHRRALEDAAAALERALSTPAPELMAEELRLATRALGRITGRVDVEDLLDVIFRDFCIGK
jgi:tRNA modification GTPase